MITHCVWCKRCWAFCSWFCLVLSKVFCLKPKEMGLAKENPLFCSGQATRKWCESVPLEVLWDGLRWRTWHWIAENHWTGLSGCLCCPVPWNWFDCVSFQLYQKRFEVAEKFAWRKPLNQTLFRSSMPCKGTVLCSSLRACWLSVLVTHRVCPVYFSMRHRLLGKLPFRSLRTYSTESVHVCLSVFGQQGLVARNNSQRSFAVAEKVCLQKGLNRTSFPNHNVMLGGASLIYWLSLLASRLVFWI
jgi:hypothetical protein